MTLTKRSLLVAGLASASVAFFRYKTHLRPRAKNLPPFPPEVRPAKPIDPFPLSDEEDGTVTRHYVETARNHPHVRHLRRSVGFTEADLGFDQSSQGSAVLLDKEGTLALTCHQIHGKHLLLRFLPHPDYVVTDEGIAASLIATDEKTDTSYWKLDEPENIEALGLEPIHWGHMGNGEQYLGKTVLSLGFPGLSNGALNASVHEVNDYQSSELVLSDALDSHGNVREFTKTTACKMQMAGALGGGESGGGVFDDVTGDFLGTITAAGEGTSFTPADAIWNGYVNLVPAARAHGYQPIEMRHAECDIRHVSTQLPAHAHGGVPAHHASPSRHTRSTLDRRHFLFLQE